MLASLTSIVDLSVGAGAQLRMELSIAKDSLHRSTTPARVDALLLRLGSSGPDLRLVDVVLRFGSSCPALPLVVVVVKRPRGLVLADLPVETRTLLLSRRIGRALLRLEPYCTALPQYPLVPSAFRWSVYIHIYMLPTCLRRLYGNICRPHWLRELMQFPFPHLL